jgi:soluble lytic murein transglycosylase
MGRAADALEEFAAEGADPRIGGYARLHAGQALLALDRSREAAESARAVLSTSPGGYLGEAALWLLADASERQQQWAEARNALRALTDIRSVRPAVAWLRLARAAEKLDERSDARAAYARVYYDFPLSEEAASAESALAKLPATAGPERFGLELGRAELLYGGRRYADAKKAFSGLRSQAKGDDRILVDLRVAQCDLGLQRFQAARDQLNSLVEKAGDRRTEVEFSVLAVLRGLKRSEYPAKVGEFVTAHPGHALAETALNDLATAYILADEDGNAAQVFTDMYAHFPMGAFADRAAWKAGWWAHRNGNYRETIRLFETASVNQRRADYRPSWLYWSAQAHEQLGEREAALTWYRRTVADYRNSYYGRLAMAAVDRLASHVRPLGSGPQSAQAAAAPAALALNPGPRPANASLVQALLAAGLYEDAVAELRRVQREAGTSPLIEATVAYALNRQGQLRPAIQAMRRAYPQFMAEGGERLPRALLTIIFPVQHWDLLERYARDRSLDFWLLLAQVAQESTFQADVRSAANAYGLMQILPSTGRRYAPKVGIRGFSTARLTDPEINVKIGTAYFVDLLEMFDGDAAPALAAYNAGESRVARWRAERPGLARDEFIDDIPFPETQNYVKRILGTAEDYRILYGAADRLVRQSDR